jgi:phosphate acetyltransferase
MSRSLYITSAEGNTGKSTVVLGLLDALRESGRQVGVFRPVSRAGAAPDYILELLLTFLGDSGDPSRLIGTTYEAVHADPESALSTIVARFRAVARENEVTIILGSDYTDVSSPTELAFNARVAANLGAPVVLVLSGRRQGERAPASTPVFLGEARTPAEMAQVAELTVTELVNEHATLAAIVANRVDPDQVRAITDAIGPVAAAGGDVPVWSIPEDAMLVAPTFRALVDAVGGERYQGDEALFDQDVLGIVVSAMSMENVLTRLVPGAAVVVPGDRPEVLLAVLMAHEAGTFPQLAGIVLNGGYSLSPAIERLLVGHGSGLPIVQTPLNTFETVLRIVRTRGRLAAESRRKLKLALDLFHRHVPSAAVRGLIETATSTAVTPLMFEYGLLDRATANLRHIVLPEGEDDRILRASHVLLERLAVSLTILGDPALIRERASGMGLDLDGANLVSPFDPALREQFAQVYADARAHKGMTLERAREVVTDVSYFGTMMVHLGMADGMVSGAAHTTAHTIRPAFEIIKTLPDVSSVSSVFFMCLPDRVLVYGDCAIIPDPTADQLADIAISSARTASEFSIEPRVAMLSYSTGTSGQGDAVEKVRQATAMVRERQPDLLVEGPIQYDAAADVTVAAAKLPESSVAGHATVFIFPDLNTGNNTYKAVQRSAGAVAIGPVLQGLKKPINDLSRGALVEDIINTVAITAIQAQQEHSSR